MTTVENILLKIDSLKKQEQLKIAEKLSVIFDMQMVPRGDYLCLGSNYDFWLEDEYKDSLFDEIEIKNLQDLLYILKTADSVNQIDEIREVIATLILPIKVMFEFDQQNSAHQYDLWFHCLHTVIELPRNLDDDMLYLGALLHDIGKPVSQCKGKKEEDINMHYYGHPKKSAEIVRNEIFTDWDKRGIYLSEDDKRRLLYYVEYHDDHVSLRLKHLRRHLEMATLEEFQNLMLLQVADAIAHVQIPVVVQRREICQKLSGDYAVRMYERIQMGE